MSRQEIDFTEKITEFSEKTYNSIKDHYADYDLEKRSFLHGTALAIILVMAFTVRIFPSLQGWDPLIKAFDPWFQLRSAEYIFHNGLLEYFKWTDEFSWFPYGRNVGASMYIAIPAATILIYWILNLLGFHVTFATAGYFVPVVFGTITVYFSYLLGRELMSKRAGLITALIMSVTPAFIQRSIAGFLDNEAVGVLFTVMSLYFFIKALRRGSTTNSIFAGISLALLASSWGAYRFTYDFIGIFALVLVMTGNYSERLVKVYSITLAVAVQIMILIPRVGGAFILSTEGIGPIGVLIFLIIFGLIDHLSESLPPKLFRQFIFSAFVSLLALASLFAILLASFGSLELIGSKFISVILPNSRNALPLIQSVSEHQPVTWAALFANLNMMVFFVPLGIYFAMVKPTERNIFLVTFGLITIYFSGSMIRLVLLLAPASALLTAMAVDNLLIPYALISHNRIKITKTTMKLKKIDNGLTFSAYLIVGLMLSVLVISGIEATATSYSAPSILSSNTPSRSLDDWFQAVEWMQSHSSYQNWTGSRPGLLKGLPPAMLSWWDYGYYITSLGNTITLADGATINSTQIGVVGTMLMWNATAALPLMYKYNVKYILVNSQAGLSSYGSDLAKAIWMIKISSQYTPQFGIKENKYFDPRSGYTDLFYKSVLYNLIAYKSSDMTGTAQSAPPFVDRPSFKNSILAGVDKHNVLSLPPFFKEAFRSTGFPTQAGVATTKNGDYPMIRIYEVVYPSDILLQVAAFNQKMAKIGS